nr:MAG TPA: hypothetical protein [Caudoviricetes sp.]
MRCVGAAIIENQKIIENKRIYFWSLKNFPYICGIK